MAEFTDFTFESSTGKNRIHARMIRPEGEVRGVVQIAHGIAEHINRYDEFMEFLAGNGFVACGNDHLGHGQSIESDYDKGIFAPKNGWKYVVSDMVRLHDKMAADFPGVPYILFGHSMGSFLARTYLIDYPEKYDLAILSGTGMQSSAVVAAGYVIANVLTKINGARSDGQKMNDIAFSSYCDKIENPKTPFDWLSRDEANVQKYIDDPLCGFVAKTSLYRDMMGGILYISSQSNIDKMNKNKPVYLMSGSADPVGEYGKGVEKTYKAFCSAGLRDVMIRLYPEGRHEMLNETNKEQVMQDILCWINERV